MIRNDVKHLAQNLSTKSGISTFSIYAFLIATGKAKSTNPCKLNWAVGDGVIFPAGERDTYCLQYYTASLPRAHNDGGDYWHDRIMDRQDINE